MPAPGEVTGLQLIVGLVDGWTVVRVPKLQLQAWSRIRCPGAAGTGPAALPTKPFGLLQVLLQLPLQPRGLVRG